jgi:hypothetical protein
MFLPCFVPSEIVSDEICTRLPHLPHTTENRVSSSIFLYSSVPRNITEIYSSVPKLRKVPVTDERRAAYSSVHDEYAGVNRRRYGFLPGSQNLSALLPYLAAMDTVVSTFNYSIHNMSKCRSSHLLVHLSL